MSKQQRPGITNTPPREANPTPGIRPTQRDEPAASAEAQVSATASPPPDAGPAELTPATAPETPATPASARSEQPRDPRLTPGISNTPPGRDYRKPGMYQVGAPPAETQVPPSATAAPAADTASADLAPTATPESPPATPAPLPYDPLPSLAPVGGWSFLNVARVPHRGGRTTVTAQLQRKHEIEGATLALRERLRKDLIANYLQPALDACPELAHLRALKMKRAELELDLQRAEAAIEQGALDRRKAPLELPAAAIPARLAEIDQAVTTASAEAKGLRAGIESLAGCIKDAGFVAHQAIATLQRNAKVAGTEESKKRLATVGEKLLAAIAPHLDELVEIDLLRLIVIRSDLVRPDAIEPEIVEPPQKPSGNYGVRVDLVPTPAQRMWS